MKVNQTNNKIRNEFKNVKKKKKKKKKKKNQQQQKKSLKISH